ncbi:MAG: TRAP transporter small permease subunit [Alphaproteobacteria bacterium]|nr:MAG: TRAP transporter small permease subunit [Alphaproteobacteria bacterium]
MSQPTGLDRALARYVRAVDGFNRRIGRMMMYGIFVMLGILLWSSISKTFFRPSLWTLEMAQFALTAYYILGGPYSIQLGSNVRMDLLYGSWAPRTRAWVDAFSVFALIFYLAVMLHGAAISTAYALGHFGDAPWSFLGSLAVKFVTGGPDAVAAELGHLERSYSSWRPYMWPIKTVMMLGIVLMLLQAVSEFCKDVMRLRGTLPPEFETAGEKVSGEVL